MKTLLGFDLLIPAFFKEGVSNSRNKNRKLPAFLFLVTSALILFLTACAPNNTASPAVLPPTEQEITPRPSDVVATTNTAESTATAIPTDVPTISLDSLLLQAPESWPDEYREQYSVLFSDPFGVTVFDSTMSAAKRTEWKTELEALDVQLDNAWHEQLANDTQWQAKLSEWDMPVPDITKWDSLSVADKRSAVKAYWKSHNITEGNLPSNYLVEAKSNLDNYVLHHKENGIMVGFQLLSETLNDRTLPKLELTNAEGTRGKFAMFGEGAYVPWLSTMLGFTTRGDGVIGLVHMIGVDPSTARYLWLDVHDDRPTYTKMRRDVFSIVPLNKLSLKGGLCLDPSGGSFNETNCPQSKTTSGFVQIDSADIDSITGIKQVSDVKLLIQLLAACKERNCILQADTANEFPVFINGIRVVDKIGLFGVP